MQLRPAEIGPRSPRRRLRRLDGRTAEAKYLRRVENDLLDHLGGRERVSAPQWFLVQRVAVDLLRLGMLDGKIMDGTFGEYDSRVAHALRNSVRLALRDLGLRPTPPRPPTLAEHRARLLAERDAAEAATEPAA